MAAPLDTSIGHCFGSCEQAGKTFRTDDLLQALREQDPLLGTTVLAYAAQAAEHVLQGLTELGLVQPTRRKAAGERQRLAATTTHRRRRRRWRWW